MLVNGVDKRSYDARIFVDILILPIYTWGNLHISISVSCYVVLYCFCFFICQAPVNASTTCNSARSFSFVNYERTI